MKIYHDFNDFVKVPNAIVTIGTFDGVHLGHQAILKDMIKTAKEIGGETVVITFYPHPRQVLNLDSSNLRFITTQEEKIRLLEEIGIDNLIIVNFTKEFSRITSDCFIRDYVIGKISPVRIVIGYDHHFGKNRMGDFNQLHDLSLQYRFKVQRIPAQDVQNIAVSSTKIRHSLEQGDVEHANTLLGYQFSYKGRVISGERLGREIGYRTANLAIGDEYRLIKASGVYASYADYEDKVYKAMTYIGRKPTVNDSDTENVEVHILDFEGDLYDKELKVRFVSKIRDDHKFDNIEALRNQIKIDEKKIRELL